MRQRIEIVEATVAELVDLGASVQRRTRHDDPPDPVYFVVTHHPEGRVSFDRHATYIVAAYLAGAAR